MNKISTLKVNILLVYMDLFTIDENFYKLIFIGSLTGATASFVGGGAEILIVPLLVYMNVISNYKDAIATSLASLLLPIGIIAVYLYYKKDKNSIKWNYALIISLSFILGTFITLYSRNIDTTYFKNIFAIIIIILGFVLLFSNQ